MASKLKPTTTETLSDNRSLPKGWRMVRFGDVVRDVNEAERNPVAAGLERFVGLEHIEPENLHLKQWGLLADGEISFTKRFRKGQVLFGKRRAYQKKVAVAEFDGICSSDILTFEPKGDDLLPDLLPFIVQSEGFFEHALGTSSGSLSPRTRWSQLQDYEFPLPPKDEQRRIAEILWAAENAIRTRYETEQTLKQAEVTAISSMITAGFGNTRCLPSRYFGSVPAHWQEASLESICTQITDGEHFTPPREKEGVFLLSARNVHHGRIDLTEVDYVSPETYERLCKRIKPAAGDILVSCSGTIGRVCCVPNDIAFALVRSVAILKPCREVESRYLEACLQSRFLQQQIKSNTSQLAQGNLFQGAIRKLMVPLPPIAEQKKFTSVVDSFRVSIDASRSHYESLSRLKNDLLTNILTGVTHVH